MRDNLQYRMESYGTFLWWSLVTVVVYPQGRVASACAKHNSAASASQQTYLFLRSRSPEFVHEYVRQDMKSRNTKLRRREELEKSYLTTPKEL